MTKQAPRPILHIGHSPDPDDAFMWYPLADDPTRQGPDGQALTPKIDTGGYRFIHVLEDIQSLNERSQKGELEITALSIHQYPYVADQYALTSCGSSMGDGYGPMVVANRKLAVSDLKKVRIAVPGTRTTAFLALSLLLGKGNFSYEVVMFDQIIPAVASGKFDAGLIIHEGQLTYAGAGLELVVDLGAWWGQTRKLPLPLGGNAIRRDLGDDACRKICTVLLHSIEWALAHRDESVAFALGYARDMGKDLASQFVGMYVNHWTLDYGERGRQAVRLLLREAGDAGIAPRCDQIDFVSPG